MLVEFSNISLKFGKHQIFSQFDFNLKQGEKLALLGGSGLGKSSLLKLLSGIYQPTSGSIKCQATHIGYVFQEPRLLPWLTVSQNLAQALTPLTPTKSQQQHRINQALSDVSLSEFAHAYPRQLSGGMAQRVALARAFIIKPDLLLLDEPLSALDPLLKRQLTGFIQQYLANYNPALIYVSHSPEDALPLVERCLLLKKLHPPTYYPVASKADMAHIIHLFNQNESN